MFCLPYYKAFKGKGKSFVREQMGTSSTNTECITVWPLPPEGQVSPNVIYNKEGADARQTQEGPSSLYTFRASERKLIGPFMGAL